jgi:cyclohexa-1,5-dienecarbonyl-CoA hydratase
VSGAAPTPPLKAWRDRDGRLLRLRLARPKANVLDAAMMAGLDAALHEYMGDCTLDRSDPEGATALRGVLLDAEGPHFSFGASVEEHLPERVAGMLSAFHRVVLRLLAFPVPVLVAIRGQCLGGGLELASAGHLLFAAPDARLAQPEIALGVFAPAASCLLPERIGRAAAEDLLLSGRTIDGREALRLGLVNAVADDPEAAALAYFDEHLAGRSASSLRHAVTAVRLDLVERVRARLAALEHHYLGSLMSTRDAVEGLTAFLEKRAPRWSR